jgi:hypothetical protein
MTAPKQGDSKPLWLAVEEEILEMAASAFSAKKKESLVHRLASRLDERGFNVSRTGGKLLDLRWAVDARLDAGRALLGDIKKAVAALKLDDVANPRAATSALIDKLGKTWPALKEVGRDKAVLDMVSAARLKLLTAHARNLQGDQGVRYLREQDVADADILEGLGISQEELDGVDAAIAAELAEAERVTGLLNEVADQSKQDQIKHLLNNEVADALVMQRVGVEQADVDAARSAIEEALKEKQRQAEEEAARKKAEAEGPALDAIPADQMLEHIEAIREILEFSNEEKEIRVMCEQSSIPKCVVDIAVTDPDKLDELEKRAGG